MGPAADAAGSLQERRVSTGRGWYATLFALALILTVTVGYVTGLDAVAATSRFLWNATALITSGTLRAAGGLLLLLARGIGWHRLASAGAGWRVWPPPSWAWASATVAAFC
jgi:hypothetical protein